MMIKEYKILIGLQHMHMEDLLLKYVNQRCLKQEWQSDDGYKQLAHKTLRGFSTPKITNIKMLMS